MKIRGPFAACLFGTLICSAVALADAPHPFHISTAEMEFNKKTGLCEVSLKLHSTDLEKALAAEAGKRVNLEKENAQVQITEYLDKHFVLFCPAKTAEVDESSAKQQKILRSKINFVGKEFKTSWLWLYFEMKPPAELNSLKLQNTILLETTSDQINTVSVRNKTRRVALKFDRKNPRLDFSSDWLK